MGRQSRPRPISCHFCRLRKLRCSRVFPCSNCTSRGQPCPDPQDPPAPAKSPTAKRSSPGSVAPTADADVLSRLERLEALLVVRDKQPGSRVETAAQAADLPVLNDTLPVVPQQLPQSQQPLHQPLPPKFHNLTADALFLEQTCLGPKLSESVLAENIVFRICSIHLITQSCSSYVFQNPTVPSLSLSFEPTRCIWLPQRHETKVLVDKYLTYTTYIHHIVHGPSLRALVDHVYDSLQNGTQAPMGPAIFLLALCADVTYSWTPRDEETGLFMNSEEANLQAMFWLKAALDLLDNAQRNGHASVECIQGLLLMSFVIFNLEGISARARSIISKAIVMSRELGLHRIDHPSNTMTSQTPRRTALEAEVGRRVWWYLAATDWMMARFPGPHEGTYYINPNQMAVRKPLNIDDENLTEGGDFVGLPIEEPTCMSYFLQRMRLAELSRTFSDRLGLYASSPDTTRYNFVLEIDEAIEKLIQEIPPFFTMEASELRKLLPTDRRRSIGLIVQRHIINLFVQGQRCKIHIPFFARGTVEPAYARSREVCLKTAQIILETEHELERENVTFVSTRLRLTAVLHSVFLASIALLLDLCLGTDAEVKAKSREQMAQAWRILDGAHGQCLPATRLQDLLRQVMKKNKIPLPVTTRETNSTSSMGSGPRDALPLTPSSTTNQGPSPATTSTDPPYFGSDWDNFDSGMDLDEIDWDSILLGLDAPLV